MKKCKTCQLNKNYICFQKNKRYKDGYKNQCKSCIKSYRAKYYKENKESLKKYSKDWVSVNHNYRTNYYEENKEKEISNKLKWQKENKGSVNENTANYRAKKRSATIGDYRKELKEIYKNCPEGHEVDHIMPLQGIGISGLHVPWNLQYLTVKENRMKSNKV
jgi:hypothetical protein